MSTQDLETNHIIGTERGMLRLIEVLVTVGCSSHNLEISRILMLL